MQILVAGPGTGKTTRIKGIVQADFAGATNILVLSFTNATVGDLKTSFANWPNVDCYTLHSYALKINHLKDYYILDSSEEAPLLGDIAGTLQVDFQFLSRQLRCITFDAMISECFQFLKSNPVYAREKIGRLDLLIVDEYQDFNPTERDLIAAISQYASETIVLGDDDQSIYGFKDADPDGIIDLHRREDVQKLVHDNKCFRCPDAVVESATRLIAQNKNRIDKPWVKTGKPGTVITKQFLTQDETSHFVVSEVERIRQQDQTATFLVLSPVGFYVDQLRDLLTQRGIPIVDFWNAVIPSEEYRKAWWLRAIFSRRKLLNLLFLHKQLSPYNRKKLTGIVREALQKDFDQGKVIQAILPMYDAALALCLVDPPPLQEFAKAHVEFAALVERLDPVDREKSLDQLLREMNPPRAFDPQSVNMMSIHKSKGLQADVVFLTGLVNGVLPNHQKGVDTVEAQRRLLFVGITRALRSLYLLSAVEWDGTYVHRVDKSQFEYSWRKKKWNARTSTFIDEMM